MQAITEKEGKKDEEERDKKADNSEDKGTEETLHRNDAGPAVCSEQERESDDDEAREAQKEEDERGRGERGEKVAPVDASSLDRSKSSRSSSSERKDLWSGLAVEVETPGIHDFAPFVDSPS